MRYIRGTGWGATTKTMITFYKAFIRGKIDYASIVYDSAATSNKKKLTVVQSNALTTIAGASKGTSTEALEVALGILPLELRRKELRLNYWAKVATNDKNPAANSFISNYSNTGEFPLSINQWPSGWKVKQKIEGNQELTKAVNTTQYKSVTPPWILNAPKQTPP
jgi:hypothetical protein